MDNCVILISSDSSDAGSPVSVGLCRPRTFEFQNVDNAAPCSSSSTALPSINKESELNSKIGGVLSPTLSQFSLRIMQNLADSDDDDGHHTSGGNEDWPPAQSYNCTLSPTQDTCDLSNISSGTETMPNIPVCKSDCFTSDASKRLAHTLSDDSDEDLFPSCHSSQESNRFAHTLSDDSEDEAFLPWLKQSQNLAPLSERIGKEKVVIRNSDPEMKKSLKLKRPTANTKTAVEDRRNAAKADKERKKEERLRKLAAQAESKAVKRALAQEQKMYKPEECLKYLTAELDNCLFAEEFGGDLKTSLEEVEVSYAVRAQIIPLSISWTRKLPDGEKIKIHEEDHTMIVIPCERVMQLVQSHSLCAAIQNMQAIMPDKKISIVLHGTEKYFQYQKKGKSKKSDKVSREDFMDAMVEVQLFTGCTHRFVDSSLELATLIAQYSKAVAEIPHRKAKARKENDKLDWFGESDNRDCVHVDKNGLGLQRLWQQQLCQFNLAGLQAAEAITSVYHSPQALFKAYDVCSTQAEGEKLLQDIPIRRDLGALSSVRRIGPELSKKLYTFFNTSEGHVELSQE